MAPHGHIEDVPEEPRKDSNDSDPDWTPDSDPDLDPDPDPDPKSDPKPGHNDGNLIKSLSKAIKNISKSVHKDPSESQAKNRDPNMFDCSDLKKQLRDFLLQWKLNFWSKPNSFCTKQLKVNYSLSFLKGTTLDYFELYLTSDSAKKNLWLNNYKLFIEELLINFGPYSMMANAEVELEHLIRKDNHKATKFFNDFYWLTLLLQYNNETLYWREYLALLKRIKYEWYTSTNLAHLTDSGTLFRK